MIVLSCGEENSVTTC